MFSQLRKDLHTEKNLSRYCNTKVRQAPAIQCSAIGVGEDCTSSLGHHHLDKLLVIDLTIAIYVGLTNHLIDFLISELLTEVGHHMPQLCGTDESVAMTVENLAH